MIERKEYAKQVARAGAAKAAMAEAARRVEAGHDALAIELMREAIWQAREYSIEWLACGTGSQVMAREMDEIIKAEPRLDRLAEKVEYTIHDARHEVRGV